jgi:hypothetical protein
LGGVKQKEKDSMSRFVKVSSGGPARVRMDGTTTSADTDDRTAPRARPHTAYESYKEQLNAFFNGGQPLPEHIKNLLATRPGAAEHGFDEEPAPVPAPAAEKPKKAAKKNGRAEESTRRVASAGGEDLLLTEEIRKANSPRAVTAAVDALLARGFPLPQDAEVLSKALGHSDDAVLEQALAGLLALVNEGSWKGNATLLKTRLKNVGLLSGSSSVRDLCRELGARLG